MAKVTLAVAIENELAQEGVSRIEGGKFNSPVRNMDLNDPLQEGDVITIPTDYEVLGVIIDATREDAKPVPFIMVEVKNEATGKDANMRFFPNQLAKIVFPVDESGKRLPKVKTTGTAAKHYATFNDVDDAMASLKGKSIVVTKDSTFRTERYGDHEIVNTHVYQYDLVD